MTDLATASAYGELIEPTTLKIQRVLPGPIERVWDYLTKSELRRKWLAAGDMQMKSDTDFELVWRNDELTDPPGKRPEGFGAEHRKTNHITACDPPRKLAFTFGNDGHVSFELEPAGTKVLLTLIHSRLANRSTKLGVSAGWHAHLDVLAARLAGDEPTPFWDNMARLRPEYDKRIPK